MLKDKNVQLYDSRIKARQRSVARQDCSTTNGHKKLFSGYSKKIKSLLANLKTLTNDNEFESISRLNSINANSIMLSAIRTHGRKFQQLLDDSTLHFDSPYITFLEYIERTPRSISPSIAGPLRDTKPHSKKKTTVVNMSNEHITNDELELLSQNPAHHQKSPQRHAEFHCQRHFASPPQSTFQTR